MSDFLKKMKSIFVVTTDEENQSTPQEQSNASAASSDTVPQSDNSSTVSSTDNMTDVVGTQSDQFYKILFDAMERNNQPGFDYIEFKKALSGLESLSMDEKTKFLSAYAGAHASGATSKSLVDSATVYLEVLSTESDKFKKAVDVQKNKQITNRQNEVKQLNNLISGKMDQITKLQAEIEDHKKMLTSIQNEIGTSQEKINKTIADFDVTYEGLVKKIRDDIDRIKTYINN